MEAQRTELGLDTIDPQFAVYTSKDFSDPAGQREVTVGATVFLYRVLPNIHRRTPAGRVLPDGRRRRTSLPLDLHLIVTIWGDQADTQNLLVGWVLRELEDYPTIPASVLNLNQAQAVFDPEESVELTISEMSGEEILQLWDQLGNGGDIYYRISIPYIVRAVSVESSRFVETGDPTQVRTLDMQRFDGGGA